MHFKAFYAIATALLITLAQSAIVGAPAGADNPFAIELPAAGEANNALAARDKDPLACDGWCWGYMQCCLIAGIYSRCHKPHTPCSMLSWPDALSAPSPLLAPATTTPNPVTTDSRSEVDVTVRQTMSAPQTTWTVTVKSWTGGISAAHAANEAFAATAAPEIKAVITEITTQVVSMPVTTTVTAMLSTIATPPAAGTATVVCTSGSSFPCETRLNVSSIAASSAPPNGTTLPPTTTSATAQGAQSTITSIATTMDSATTTSTRTASLNGAPSAIASDFGQTGGAAALVLGGRVGVVVSLMRALVVAGAVLVMG